MSYILYIDQYVKTFNSNFKFAILLCKYLIIGIKFDLPTHITPMNRVFFSHDHFRLNPSVVMPTPNF